MQIKPTVASLVLDDTSQHHELLTRMESDIDHHPITVLDSHKYEMEQDQYTPTAYSDDVDQIGAIICDKVDHNDEADDDPIFQALKSSQSLLNSSWAPQLNVIAEETIYDLKIALDKPIVKSTTHVSSKRHRGRIHQDCKLRHQYESKIKSAIHNNGIYKTILNTAQNDSGANRSVTNQKHLLVNFRTIPRYAINGVNEGNPAIHCTGIGYLPWKADTGELLLVRCLYCKEASGTILSPSDINLQYQDKYNGWTLETKFDSQQGQLMFNSRDGINHLVFTAYSDNNLWYHYLDQVSNDEYKRLGAQTKAVVNTLNANATYHIWHHRLGHASHKVMMEAHKHCIGIPKMKQPSFFNCSTCHSSKFRKKHIGPSKSSLKPANVKSENIEVGQHLHIDFGFVRGSDYSSKDATGRLVTSIDGYRSYCLVIDRASRYVTIILTKSKEPPIKELRHIFQQFRAKVKAEHCTVTTDLGGELAGSKSFIQLLMEPDVKYVPRTTAAFSSAQNGLAEKPNQDLARMMRSLLYGAGLGSKYWSYALRHSVYLKNRLPHSAIHYVTPYEKVNKMKPDLSNLRVFGSRVHFLHKHRNKKLDKMDNTGKFMTYKGTDKIVYVIDDNSGKERVTSHVNYDEAYTSVSASNQPPMATALQQSGYVPEKEEICRVKFKTLHSLAKIPEKGSDGAAALDLYAVTPSIIQPGTQATIPTGLSMQLQPQYHAELHVRSSYASKYQARVEAGIIDSDYRGQIYVIMSNNGAKEISIQPGDRFAQMLIVRDPTITVEISHELSCTQRNVGKFGSTGFKDKLASRTTHPTTASAAALHDYTDGSDGIMQAQLSTNPYADEQYISFTTLGKHPTQGMILEDSPQWNNRVVIKTCKPGTATAKITNWVKRLKNSVLMEIDGVEILSSQQAKSILHNKPRGTKVKIKIGLQDKVAMHDDFGTPMLYFDQLHAIAQHLQHIKMNQYDESISIQKQSSDYPAQKLAKAIKKLNIPGMIAALHGILPKNQVRSKRLTRKKLQQSSQWQTWKNAEWKQLDQYWEQKMFGNPCPLPPNSNVLGLLWDYRIKDDGTHKARMVCNGRPSNKNTVIFGYTYAKSLDHVGARIFWAMAAIKNFVVQGADASNAFAEADAPTHKLYVRVNDQYREWWNEHKGNSPIPKGYVLPVHKALQGHPEAPRAWATKIDSILQTKLHFTPTTHEPCLYTGMFKGHEILFLRQVDDFAVAAANKEVAGEVIKTIDKYMSIKIKDLGSLTRYNGVDVLQTRHFIKLHNPTYIKKIIHEHKWMIDDQHVPSHPTPMSDDREYMRKIETATPPPTEQEQRQLQVNMKFNYRQAIGELIYAMVTCRPDISFPLIKLSQHSANPAQIHYEAVVNIFRYLHATIDDGIIYWRKTPNMSLTEHPMPQVHHDNYTPSDRKPDTNPSLLNAAVDSDWAGDSTHRRSVTGIILRIAGGCVFYKTKYQDTIALSTTEAEFTAACDAGKAILYVRSILHELHMHQDEATPLYIDNNGALLMGNAQQPTRRTRHMDLKKFSIQHWIKKDLMLMFRIKSTDNWSDVMTKQTGRQLFYRHYDYIMGRIIPNYVKLSNSQSTVSTIVANTYYSSLQNDNMIYSPSQASMCSRNMEGISCLG